MTISLIIPIYNKEQYLRRCLGSIRNQTHKDIEVWMVDDGSTDGSADICKEYEEKDKRFHYVYRENSGWCSAPRNTGLELATGEWVGFPDPDDYVEPIMYERLLRNSKDADMVLCNMHTVDVRTGRERAYRHQPGHYGRLDERVLNRPNCDIGFIARGIYKRELIGDLRFIKSFHEDAIWAAALLNKSQKGVNIINEQLYNYFIYPDSINHKGFSKEFVESSLKEIYQFVFKSGIFENNPSLKKRLINHLNRAVGKRYKVSLNF